MNDDLKMLNERINDYRTQIDRENEKLREAQEGKQEKLVDKIKRKGEQINEKKTRIDELQKQETSYARAAATERETCQQAEAENTRLQQELVTCDHRIQQLTSAVQGEVNK